MQNKPNFKDAKMNVNSLTTMNYENISDWTLGQNKPNSNPISKRPKMNANAFSQKDYRKNNAFAVPKNKPNQTQFPLKKGFIRLMRRWTKQNRTLELFG